MDCRRFEEQHVAYVDDVLSAHEMTEMRRHVERCDACAELDAAVRRGLLVARNMPRIEPSADFMDRLQARLAERVPDGCPRELAPFGARVATAPRALLAAGILIGAALAAGLRWNAEPRPILMAPVVATAPEPAPSPVPTPVYVASFAAGLPVWSAAMMTDETPVHLATTELREER